MKVYTGCFFKEYPGAVKVSIARSEPTFFGEIFTIKDLAPGRKLLQDYKARIIGIPEYKQRYRDEVLAKLNKNDVLRAAELASVTFGGQDVILCCWEKTGFCHRQLVAEWLGIEEYTGGEKQ